jgi:hypothetical protein
METKELLIVTCEQHIWQFLIQCKSIYTYLAPCQINIVINEKDPSNWISWFNTECVQYFINHKLSLYTTKDFDYQDLGNRGYITQQSIKLMFCYKTDNEYIILDTKNWFIKPTDINEIPRQEYDPNLINRERFDNFYRKCVKQFGKPTAIRNIETPYIFNPLIVKRLINRFTNEEQFLKWFTDTSAIPSEFMCYSMFAQSINLEQDKVPLLKISKTIWTLTELSNWQDYLNSNLKITGIHKSLLDIIDKENIEKSLNLITL